MLDRLNFPQPWLSLLLFTIWQFLSDGISGASVVMGIILAWLIPQITQGFWPERPAFIHAWRMPFYLLRVLGDIVIASFSDPEHPQTGADVRLLPARTGTSTGYFHPRQHHFTDARHRERRCQ